MSDGEDDEVIFVCSECRESLEVNGEMKRTLIERGCVICGTPVTEEAFTDGPPTDSS